MSNNSEQTRKMAEIANEIVSILKEKTHCDTRANNVLDYAQTILKSRALQEAGWDDYNYINSSLSDQ